MKQKIYDLYQASAARFKILASGISSWFPFVLAAIAGILALIYKEKAEKAEASAIESQTAAKDAPLVAQQAQDEVKLKEANEDIQKIMDEREKLRNKYVTDQERADSWNKK